MSDLVQRARHHASQAHGRIDQRRRYSNQPYEVHLKSVATLVASVGGDEEMVAAAWLHDTVEDTPVTLEELERTFGPGVASLVDQLTDVSRPHHGNRAARKAIDRAHLAQASPRAQTVKLADLIDNARDICKHDRDFAAVFLQEMAALLPLLGEGDARLMAQARKLLTTEGARLGLAAAVPEGLPTVAPAPVAIRAIAPQQRRLLRLFNRILSALDIAEPLPSCDAIQPAEEVARVAQADGRGVIGVRIRGQVAGYVRAEDLTTGTCADHLRPFAPSQVLEREASLTDVVQVLTRHEHCFVTVLDEVVGQIGRAQMQSPAVRMWLFGIITSYEMGLTELLRDRTAPEHLREALTPARVAKAEELQRSRQALGHAASLLDCLQLSDKLHLLMADPTLLEALGFDTRGKAKRVAQELESLRNHLAHAQDIVTHDWAQIARLARRIDLLAAGGGFSD